MSKALFIFLSLSFALLLQGDSGIASDTYSPEASGSIRFPAGDKEKTLALFIDALLEKETMSVEEIRELLKDVDLEK